MKSHTLKIDPAVFADVLSGAKTFEIRFNDRDFQVGDTLRLLETEHDGADMKSGAPLIYTGREVTKTVSHILTGYGLADGWCCLSFARPKPVYLSDAWLYRYAQEAAFAMNGPSYAPKTAAAAKDFMPHPWVLEVIQSAWLDGQSGKPKARLTHLMGDAPTT